MSALSAAELERLRAAFAAPREEVLEAGGCPSPDRLWDAQRGALGGAGARAVVEHMAGCRACAEDWRLGLALARLESAEEGSPRRRRRRALGPLLAAAAALAAVIVLALPLLRPPPDAAAPVYRGVQPHLVAEDQVCVAADCVLTWAAGPPGSVYDVSVTTVDFDLVVVERGLKTPSYRVPPERLAAFARGSRLYWQVEASLPNGRSAVSKTLLLTLE